jgi:hypothetical protein
LSGVDSLTRLTRQAAGPGPHSLSPISPTPRTTTCAARLPGAPQSHTLFRDAKQPLAATAYFVQLPPLSPHSSLLFAASPACQLASHLLRNGSDSPTIVNRSVVLDNYSGSLAVECVRQSPPRPSNFVTLGRGEPLVQIPLLAVRNPLYSKYDRRGRPERESYNRLGHRVC